MDRFWSVRDWRSAIRAIWIFTLIPIDVGSKIKAYGEVPKHNKRRSMCPKTRQKSPQR